MKKVKISLILAVGLILAFVLGYKFLSSNEQASTNYHPADLQNAQIDPQDLKYEVIQKGEALGLESYLILVSSNDPATVNQIALKVKKQECKMPCNVHLFDDKEAITSYLEYDKLMKNRETNPEQRNSWNKEHYIYVADHYVGTMNFTEDGFFTSYPNRDPYYKALKEGGI